MSALTIEPRQAPTVTSAASLLDAEHEMLSMIRRGAALAEVLAFLCRTVEAHAAGALTSVLLLENKRQLRHGAGPSLPEPYNQAIDGLEIGPDVGSCGTAAFSRKLVIVSDVSTDPLWANFKELAARYGLRSCWSTPVFGTGGDVLGTFAIYHRAPREPAPEEIALIERVAVIARVAIEWHAAEAERRQLIDAAQRAQRQAEAERAALRDFVMQAPALLAILRGPKHVFEIANEKYLEIVGGREVIGKEVAVALPEAVDQGFVGLLDGVYRTGIPFVGNEVPVTLHNPNSGVRTAVVNFVYSPIFSADRKVEGIAVYANEVTELVEARKRVAATLEAERAAWAAVEASQAQFRTLFDAMPQLGWTALADGTIDFYNRGWYDYTGTTFEQMKGWGWKSVHDPEILPRVIERWQHSLTTGTPFEMEFPLRRHDGVFRWFLTRVNPLRDATGKVLRWVGVNTDIDDLRAARALAEEIASQVKDTEARFRELRAAKEAAERALAERR